MFGLQFDGLRVGGLSLRKYWVGRVKLLAGAANSLPAASTSPAMAIDTSPSSCYCNALHACFLKQLASLLQVPAELARKVPEEAA